LLMLLVLWWQLVLLGPGVVEGLGGSTGVHALLGCLIRLVGLAGGVTSHGGVPGCYRRGLWGPLVGSLLGSLVSNMPWGSLPRCLVLGRLLG